MLLPVWYLWAVSILWSFSFGLISNYLGGLPAGWLALVRLGLAFAVLLPFCRPNGLKGSHWLSLAAIGGTQYGLMYLLYFQSFPHLPGRTYLLALFTVTTPIYVVLFDDCFRREWHSGAILPLALAMGGAALIRWPWGQETGWESGYWTAFFLMQGSNAAFAIGQIAYREVKRGLPQFRDRELYAIVFSGGVLVCLGITASNGSWWPERALDASAIGVLVFLGAVSSGLGFFWWNRGATLVSAPTLAVMNNMKIPLAVAVSLLVFGEVTDARLLPLASGSLLLLLALFLVHRRQTSPRVERA